MGATNFETIATGKTAREAFLNAVNDAHYWNGHGGYTGTIAEKPGFVEFAVPLAELPERKLEVDSYDPKSKSMVVTLVAEDVINRLSNAIYYYRWELERKYPWESGDKEICAPSWVKPEKVDEYIKHDRERRERARADLDFFVAKMGLSKWKQMCELYEEKWSEAVAIKMSDDEWLFCGMASC